MRSKHLVAAHSNLETRNRRLSNQTHGINTDHGKALRNGLCELFVPAFSCFALCTAFTRDILTAAATAVV
jgi:hypothetical protein